MTSAKDLLHAIGEEPDDMVRRLVYADWLDDNNEPDRAEFVRKQCEIASGQCATAELQTLQSHEQELLRIHGAKWRKEYLDSLVYDEAAYKQHLQNQHLQHDTPPESLVKQCIEPLPFDRGIIPGFRCNTGNVLTNMPNQKRESRADWLEGGMKFLHSTQSPLLSFEYVSPGPHGYALDNNAIKDLRSLDLSNAYRSFEHLSRLQLPHLENLDLSNTGFGNNTSGSQIGRSRNENYLSGAVSKDFEILKMLMSASPVRHLNLSNNTLYLIEGRFGGQCGIDQLGEMKFLHQLETLDLSGSLNIEQDDQNHWDITAENIVQGLATWQGFDQLRVLKLKDNLFSAENIEALCGAIELGQFPQIESVIIVDEKSHPTAAEEEGQAMLNAAVAEWKAERKAREAEEPEPELITNSTQSSKETGTGRTSA